MLDGKTIASGASNFNNGPYPSVGDILMYMKGLEYDRTGIERKTVIFGSMGRKGGTVDILAKELNESGFDVIDTFEVYHVPDEEKKEFVSN